jgi:hypothetical protein
MKRVTREEILDYATYAERRGEVQQRLLAVKAARRVHLGAHFTFLFENTETVRYQIQEMMRVERIVKEADIQHEIDTYNELLGRAGELGCTLLIEIDDAGERERLLGSWRDLPAHVYVRLEDDTRVYAAYDERQVDPRRLSSVQYLKFATKGRVPAAIGCDLESAAAEVPLSDEQRQALRDDLGA